MAGGAGAEARIPQRDARWKWLLFGLCGLSLIITVAIAADVFGVGGRPWFGWWDALHVPTGAPYVLGVTEVRPAARLHLLGSAPATGSIFATKRLGARIGVIFQPLATRTTTLRVARGSQSLDIAVMPTTGLDNARELEKRRR